LVTQVKKNERRYILQSFESRLRQLKKDFQRNVGPSIRRHRYYLTKSERSRLKHEKAIKRLNKKRSRRAYV
jgi:ribosomal protein S21